MSYRVKHYARVYLGLGGNQGDPARAIRDALAMIATDRLGRVAAVSSFFSTEPVGLLDQPWFVNAAAAVDTDLDPETFLTGLRSIEARLGRPEDRIKDGPRPIDLDILLWGDQIIRAAELAVPHPRMHQRAFVIIPLAQIAPQAIHPTLNRTIASIKANLADPAKVVLASR